MLTDEKVLEEIRERIIGCAIAVHTELGPGLLESIYQECLVIALTEAGLRVVTGRQVPVVFRGRRVKHDLKLDILVEDCVVVEVKAVEQLHPVHTAQLITYLKLTGCPTGLLINFNSTSLRRGGIRRATHPTLYRNEQNKNDLLTS